MPVPVCCGAARHDVTAGSEPVQERLGQLAPATVLAEAHPPMGHRMVDGVLYQKGDLLNDLPRT